MYSVTSFLQITILGLLSFSAIARSESSREVELYQLCQRCHGTNGEGRLDVKAPAIAGMAEWYVVAQLEKFRAGLRGYHPSDDGGMRMRPMALVIRDTKDLQAIAKYVSSLPSTNSKPTVIGNPIAGQRKFQQVCSSCHGKQAEGNLAQKAPSLSSQDDWYLLQQLINFQSGARGSQPAKDPVGATMAAMVQTLSQDEMKNIVAYIKGL